MSRRQIGLQREAGLGKLCIFGTALDTAAAQASAPLLWCIRAELAVAGADDGAGRPEADGRQQGTPAKAGARSCRHHAAGTGGAQYVVTVAGAHIGGACAPVHQVRRRRVMISGRTSRLRMQSRFRTWRLIKPWVVNARRKWHQRRRLGGCGSGGACGECCGLPVPAYRSWPISGC